MVSFQTLIQEQDSLVNEKEHYTATLNSIKSVKPSEKGDVSKISCQYLEHKTSLCNYKEKKFVCNICEKTYKRKSSLATHLVTHTDIKPFKCLQCNKEFLRNSDLRKHAVMHTGDKPYVCKVCRKQFSQSSNMLTHLRRHSGVRPFSCPVCGKNFFRKVDVSRHSKRHKNVFK